MRFDYFFNCLQPSKIFDFQFKQKKLSPDLNQNFYLSAVSKIFLGLFVFSDSFSQSFELSSR